MGNLVKQLRVTAESMEMGEKIAWGSDTALMKEAADRIEMLESALQDIRKHQEIIGGSLAKMGAIWNIADKALNNNRG